MSSINDVKNLYEGIAAEAFKMPERIDPSDIRKAQRAKKVRKLATDGATEGERAAAARKTKGPKMMGEGKYSNSETYVKGTAPVRATYGGKTESFPKETYKKKSKKDVTEDTCPICGHDPCQCLEGTLAEKKKEETNIGGGNLGKLIKKAVKRVDMNADGTADGKDMKSGDIGEFVPSTSGKRLKSKVRFEGYVSERTMTSKEKAKEDRLKEKYDDGDMKQNMIDQYGKEEGLKVYYATIRKKAMSEAKSDKGLSFNDKAIARNRRNTPAGADKKFDTSVFIARKLGEPMDDARARVRRMDHDARRGVKKDKAESPKMKSAKNQLRLALGRKGVVVDGYLMIAEEESKKKNPLKVIKDVQSSRSDDSRAYPSRKIKKKISEAYIEEKARGTRKKTTAHVYDMDETLYGHDHSKVRVHVNDKSGKRVQSLSNQEFNTHKLEKGHKYDFSEFGSSKTFQKSAKPLKKMIKHMKRQKARGYDTHIVTARSDFDDKKHLAKQLNKHGVNITPKKDGSHTHLHRSGNLEGSDVGKKKQQVLSQLAKRRGYKKIHMYDDAEKVHKSTAGKTPGVKVKGHMVKPNKSGQVYSRPYKPTQPKGGKNNNPKTQKEQTSYEFWKQFIA
tara:strand:+ start:571 stop:2424 length:1854 start_codon:yes stop_codon:yes gene_type:complete